MALDSHPRPDHRSHRRARIRQRVWCDGPDVTLFCRALNASLGGLFIRTPRPGAPGDRVRVSFKEPGEGDWVVADAEVVWARPPSEPGEPGMGVRIVSFERGAELYRRFVQRQLTAGSSPGLVWGLGTGSDEPSDP